VTPTPNRTPPSQPPETRGARRARGGLARSLLLVLGLLTIGPLSLIAVFFYTQAQASITTLVTSQLNSLAFIKEVQIRQWVHPLVSSLNGLAETPAVLQSLASDADPNATPGLLQAELDRFIQNHPDYGAVIVVNAETGEIIEASAGGQNLLGQSLRDTAILEEARFQAKFFPPEYDVTMEAEAVTIMTAAPVIDPQQGTVAVLVGLVRDTTLLNLISPTPGLGSTGYTYALTKIGYPIGAVIRPGFVRPTSEGIQRAIGEQRDGSGIYVAPNGQRVLGVYNWIPEFQIGLFVEQNADEAYAPLYRTAWLFALITLAAIVLSGVVGVLFTRRLSAPLQALTEGAAKLASGDLSTRVAIRRDDEIGQLAEAFNRIGDQLDEVYQGLEAKVEARTRQLSAAAEVIRAATSILDTEPLLARVADLIRERFGYYHVSIFLLDETGEHAVLREATGRIGAQLKAQGFSLPVGSQSIIGWVSANKVPRVTPDVRNDPYYLVAEQLADTRSEAGVPLRVGERVIGILDVQSREINAFSALDMEALQLLADQIAIAVENGQLFARQKRLLQLEELVISLTNRVHQTFKLETILESAATELGRALGARRAVVRLKVNPTGTAPLTEPGNGEAHSTEAPTESL
jgi:HAMP domain-containing protein